MINTMKKYISKFFGWFNRHKPFAAALALAATATTVLAEDATNPLAEVVTQAESYVTMGKTVVVTILGAGLIIVAAFYIWKLIKKGIAGAK